MSEDLGSRVNRSLGEHYRIERELDRGGMAVVFLGEDLRHARPVAIKVLQPVVAESLGAERFLREVEVIARLQHPHILTLIDSGEAEGLPYYVMPYVEGRSLARRLAEEGPLPVDEAIRIAGEVADALAYAHQHGVIHRDIKPANILLSDGHAVVADFGIAGALEYAATSQLTRTGVSLGSPVYMSPEQATGQGHVDHRTDVYSLGCVLFEMLGGEPPFAAATLPAILTRKVAGSVPSVRALKHDVPPELDAVIGKALASDPEQRHQSANELREALRRVTEGSHRDTPADRARRRVLIAGGVITTLIVGGIAGVLVKRSLRQAWAAQQLAQVERLVDAGRFAQALPVGLELAEAIPADTALARLWTRFTTRLTLRADPTGARAFIKDVTPPDTGAWTPLGRTPLDTVRVAQGRVYRLRLEADGREPLEFLHWPFVASASGPLLDTVRLPAPGEVPEDMVRIPGFARVSGADTVRLVAYLLDRFEVTNAQYKAFVDAGGYQDPAYWTEPFVDGGAEIPWEAAVARFRDASGRPGPATWSLGTYGGGEEALPVGGVSWYEAAAYARFAGKELPTSRHWGRALESGGSDLSKVLIPGSNLDGRGPRTVGTPTGMGPFGTYDQWGNVREWCWNRIADGRVARGGAWDTPPFGVGYLTVLDPWSRDPRNGFRLARTSDAAEALEGVRAPVVRQAPPRDYSVERPASDAEFAFIRRLYVYEPVPLRAQVEEVDTFAHWTRESVTFDLPYGQRGGAYLYLPREAPRPLQVIFYWGGSSVLGNTQPADEFSLGFDFLMRSGRAVALPVFEGAYWRDPDNRRTWQGYLIATETARYREAQIHWFQDLAATLDYLETREDLATGRAGYLGYSWGGLVAPIVLALEERITAAVVHVGGLWPTYRYVPEADPLNFAPRVRNPVLMLNGEHDPVFPLETAQKPLFALLGTPAGDKVHRVVPGAHDVPYDVLYRETLAWFDRYLGPTAPVKR